MITDKTFTLFFRNLFQNCCCIICCFKLFQFRIFVHTDFRRDLYVIICTMNIRIYLITFSHQSIKRLASWRDCVYYQKKLYTIWLCLYIGLVDCFLHENKHAFTLICMTLSYQFNTSGSQNEHRAVNVFHYFSSPPRELRKSIVITPKTIFSHVLNVEKQK